MGRRSTRTHPSRREGPRPRRRRAHRRSAVAGNGWPRAVLRASRASFLVLRPPLVQWYDHSPSRISRPALGGVAMRRYLVAIATAGILLGACAGGPTTTVTATASPTTNATPAPTQKEKSDQAMARLYELAKPDGTVAIYSSMNNDDAKKGFPLFEQKFPGAKGQHTRASGEDLVNKLVTEKRAGQDLMDLVEANLFEVKFL